MALLTRSLALPLLVLNFALYGVLLGLASWAYDRRANGFPIPGTNNVTRDLALISLITGVIGFSSVISGLHYVLKPGLGSRGAAAATSIIASVLTLLMLGISSKHIQVGHVGSRRLRALEAFAIIPAGPQLLHTMLMFITGRGHHERAPTSGSKV